MTEMPIQQNNVILAQAYVPYQQYKNLFPIEEALYKGTIFSDLYQPKFKQFIK
ncbi:MAG: hypothetical protein K0Q49_388 [Haloplasmataceae bacterium]|jgi:hypothetical protein|nr:hypothetical protein [Haloplasmataceae bacterium]